MANTNISICSRALVLLGEKPISSFEENRDAARACATVYDGLKAAKLAEWPWRFAMNKVKLTKVTGKPIGEYRYMHQIPAESISNKVHAVFRSPQDKNAMSNYETFSNKILSDYEELWADIKIDVVEALWPETFVNFMVYAMAAEIAFTITDQVNAALKWEQKAYGNPSDYGVGGALGAALAQEAQTQGNYAIVSDEFINSRHGGFNAKT